MEELDLKELFNLFWSKKGIIVIFILVFAIIGVVYSYYYVTPRYKSETSLLIVKEQKVVFIERIGWPLPDGNPHDLRAADYDDWQLNGDLLYWYDIIQAPIEISSMGIRVDRDSLFEQLNYMGRNNVIFEKCEYYEDIFNKKVPYTIGGGIGQSRLCMLILQKKHIGEVQASVWPKEMIDECKRNNIELL